MLSTAVRTSLVLALGCTSLGVVPSTAARAAVLEAVLVAAHSTASDRWAVPSPDPSGIAYDPVHRRLVITDGEVEEMPLYAGTNLFLSTLDGRQDPARVGGTSLPWSKEPVGAGFRASDGHLFVSDDDADRIFEVAPGPDGVHGTPDDPAVTSFSTRGVVGSDTGDTNGDPEGATLDLEAAGGSLFVIDGASKEVYEYGPGPDGRFDGVGDTVTSFDVQRHGALDPEGIEFHPERGTLLVLDSGSRTIYEVDRRGALLNAISIAAANPYNAAGMALAPASNGSGALNLYIVDRGVDNDTDPTENDGRFYEMSVALPPLPAGPPNVAPTVTAGPDVAVTRPAAAPLSGSMTDDGLPAYGALTAAWTKISGPGTVTFANAGAATTTATFSAAGNYVLRLTADDGGLTARDEVTVVVRDADGSGVLTVPVRTGADDAEERSDRTILTGADLELVQDGTAVQKVGLRFTGVDLPQGAVVRRAYVQFTADEVQTGPGSLSISAQAADDAAPFTTASRSVTGPPRTAAVVGWDPVAWPTVGARDVDQRTPDLSPVLQEIVDRPGWTGGNAVALVVTGTGTRTAAAFERGAGKAPVLHVEYGPAPGTEPVNAAPTVDAGPDVALTLPAGATLTGSLTDDGLPMGAPVTAAWTVVSGPGPVAFADPSQSSTTATFAAAGTYVLRLTGSDGLLAATDDVTVGVAPVPVQPGSLSVRIATGTDDAEQRSDGKVTTSSSDLALGKDGSKAQTVGLRFPGITIPAGAVVTNAYVQFQADKTTWSPASLTITGQASDAPLPFGTSARNLSSRPTTVAQVTWAPSFWWSKARGSAQRTPDLTPVVREIMARPGWAQGNAVVLLVTGSGTRIAESYEGGAAKAPVLHIEYGPAPLGG